MRSVKLEKSARSTISHVRSGIGTFRKFEDLEADALKDRRLDQEIQGNSLLWHQHHAKVLWLN